MVGLSTVVNSCTRTSYRTASNTVACADDAVSVPLCRLLRNLSVAGPQCGSRSKTFQSVRRQPIDLLAPELS